MYFILCGYIVCFVDSNFNICCHLHFSFVLIGNSRNTWRQLRSREHERLIENVQSARGQGSLVRPPLRLEICSKMAHSDGERDISAVGTTVVVGILSILLILKWKKLRQDRQRSTVPLSYHFTRQCNYQCGFCFHTTKTSFVLPIDEAKRGLKILKEAGMVYVVSYRPIYGCDRLIDQVQ